MDIVFEVFTIGSKLKKKRFSSRRVFIKELYTTKPYLNRFTVYLPFLSLEGK